MTRLGIALAVITFVALAVAGFSRHSTATAVLKGDADCNGVVEVVDAMSDLQKAAGLTPDGACTDQAGAFDCDHDIDAVDALGIIKYVNHLILLPDCTHTPTPSPSSTPVPTPTHSPTPSPTPSTPPTPSPTPLPPDALEPNDTAAAAFDHGSANTSSTDWFSFHANFNSQADVDWYKVTAKDDAIACPNGGPTQYLHFRVRLEQIEAASNYDLMVVADDPVSGSQYNSQLLGATNEAVNYGWMGTCGIADSKDFWIRVNRVSGPITGQNYYVAYWNQDTGNP